MILSNKTILKRNLTGASIVSLLVIVWIILVDRSFTCTSTFILAGMAPGYVGFALYELFFKSRIIIPDKDSTNKDVTFFGFWWTALGPILIGASLGVLLGYLARKALNYFSEHQLVGVKSPIAIMEVGGTDTLEAQLFYKPRYTTAQVTPVSGTITYYIGANTNNIFSLSNGQNSITVSANMSAHETITGLKVGKETLGVIGSDSAGNQFEGLGIVVHVVPNQPDSITFYELAVKLALEWWVTGWLGNQRINVNSTPPAGLCDQWMDWAVGWLPRLNKNDICVITKCINASGTHNYLQVTLCNGTILYLDPWRRPDKPVFGKAEYEGLYGPPDPTGSYPGWQKTPCCYQLGLQGPASVPREPGVLFTATLTFTNPGITATTAGIDVTFTILDGGDSARTSFILTSTAARDSTTVKTDAQGKATVRVFSGGEQGSDVLEAKVDGLNRPLEARATYATMP